MSWTIVVSWVVMHIRPQLLEGCAELAQCLASSDVGCDWVPFDGSKLGLRNDSTICCDEYLQIRHVLSNADSSSTVFTILVHAVSMSRSTRPC